MDSIVSTDYKKMENVMTLNTEFLPIVVMTTHAAYIVEITETNKSS